MQQKKIALQFILLMGLVSLFADITYEGARSITGPYLSTLGATAAIVGLVAGIGELAGYMLRLPFGYFADRTKAYWALTIVGYGLILAVPLLAFTGNWQLAAVLIVVERVGKAIRSPARDAILSYATKQVGRGLGFGIHEALDQIGAFSGPLIFAAIFFLGGTYRQGFLVLGISAFLVMAFIFLAKSKVASPQELESQDSLGGDPRLPKVFWIYTLFIFLSVTGFVNFQLVSYNIKVKTIFSDMQIPIFYAAAMAIDALAAPIVGKSYDKMGLKILLPVPLLSLLIPILAFSKNHTPIIIGILLWGVVMAIHETVIRAAIADMAPMKMRGFAYGVFNTVYGVALFLGSITMGFLYDISLIYLILFSVVMEVFSLSVFIFFLKGKQS